MRTSTIVLLLLSFTLVLIPGCMKKGAEAPALSDKELREEEAAPGKPRTARGEGEKPAAAAEGEGDDLAAVLAGVPEVNAADVAAELKLIKTADLTCEIEDVEKGFEEVYAIAAAEKAIVVETSRSVAEEGYALGSVTMKVHPSKFDETIKALRHVGRLLSENSTTEDVTEEYVDLQARLENAEAARDRYLEILATRAGAVHDILEVEREIERVTENVERFKGQLRYLDSRVGLSTITIHLEEPHAAVPTGYSFGKTIKTAFRGAVSVCIFLLAAVIILLPFVVIIIAIVVIIKLIRWLRPKSK
jgi:hypothetical protein